MNRFSFILIACIGMASTSSLKIAIEKDQQPTQSFLSCDTYQYTDAVFPSLNWLSCDSLGYRRTSKFIPATSFRHQSITPFLSGQKENLFFQSSLHWGFFAHRKINYYAVFLLPPEMMILYKPNIEFLTEHAVDPDKRRYVVAEEGPRHYIDIDHYGKYPFDSLPRKWEDAVTKYSETTLMENGIVPWWIPIMQKRLTNAFKEKDQSKILKLSAEIGHYIADAHVPLHANSNHNGQLTRQQGIHGFWESRVPELLADKEWEFFVGKAEYIKNPGNFIWKCVLESAAEADTVLKYEKELSEKFPVDKKFAFEERNGKIVRQYSSAYSIAYNKMLKGMIERRMRASVYAVGSFWYTAWVDAGQPDLAQLSNKTFSEEEQKEFDLLNQAWKSNEMKGRKED